MTKTPSFSSTGSTALPSPPAEHLIGASTRRLFAAIVAVYLLITITYSTLIPAWESNDEHAHTAYIEYVADHHAIPPLEHWGREKFLNRPGYKQVRWFESHQPPLYYFLAAGWQTALGVPPFSPFPLEYVEPRGGYPPHLVFIHDYDAKQRRHAHSLHQLRWLSILLGVGTLLGVFLSAWLAFGRHDLALASAAFLAVLPKFNIVSAVVNNDALVIFLSTWALALSLLYVRRTSRDQSRTWLLALLTGLVAGAAVITKLNSLPLACLLVLMAFLTHRPWLQNLRDTAFYAAGVLAVSGWWFLRNQQLYHEWLGQTAAIEWLKLGFGDTVSPVSWLDTERFLKLVPIDLVRTSWYVSGWNQFTLPLPWSIGLSLLALAALLSAASSLLRCPPPLRGRSTMSFPSPVWGRWSFLLSPPLWGRLSSLSPPPLWGRVRVGGKMAADPSSKPHPPLSTEVPESPQCRPPAPREALPALLFLAVLAGLLAILLIAKSTPHADGRIAYVGIAGFVPLVIWGTERLVGRLGLVVWPALLLAANAYAFFNCILPFHGL